MILEIKVPRPGESISEVEISSWLVSDGDYVEKDQIIAEIDSDKATLELPAESSGIIKLKVKEGETVKVEQVVCSIETSESTKSTKIDDSEIVLSVDKKEVVENYQIGDVVKWCWSNIHQNTYTIVEIKNTGVVLKQNFGRGTVLNDKVPISEISK